MGTIDSDQSHRAVTKNGHDQIQDRAIRDLHDDLRKHIAEEYQHHEGVEERLLGVSSTVEKYLFGGRIAWTFMLILGSLVLAYQTHLDGRVDELEDRLQSLTAQQAAFEERGTKWGEALDAAVKEIRTDIRELRKDMRRIGR